MKKLGVVNSVLAGKTVAFAHGTKSAINKQVISQRLHATELGFTNDEQGDPRFHGGIQKALHIYPSEHYPVWQQELGDKAIFHSAGAFGENLSSSGVTEAFICLKDKIRIGTTLHRHNRARSVARAHALLETQRTLCAKRHGEKATRHASNGLVFPSVRRRRYRRR